MVVREKDVIAAAIRCKRFSDAVEITRLIDEEYEEARKKGEVGKFFWLKPIVVRHGTVLVFCPPGAQEKARSLVERALIKRFTFIVESGIINLP